VKQPEVLDVLAWVTAQEPVSGFQWAGVLSSASPAFMLATFIIALSMGKIVLPREVESRDKRILQLEVERDEYKQMAFRALNVGERVVSVAEQRDRA
jgi:cell division protein FtsL